VFAPRIGTLKNQAAPQSRAVFVMVLMVDGWTCHRDSNRAVSTWDRSDEQQEGADQDKKNPKTSANGNRGYDREKVFAIYGTTFVGNHSSCLTHEMVVQHGCQCTVQTEEDNHGRRFISLLR
jgi:hypothetical protein